MEKNFRLSISSPRLRAFYEYTIFRKDRLASALQTVCAIGQGAVIHIRPTDFRDINYAGVTLIALDDILRAAKE